MCETFFLNRPGLETHAVGPRGAAVGFLEDRVKMPQAPEAALQGDIQDFPVGHLELLGGVFHPHAVEPVGRGAPGGPVQHAGDVFRAPPRQAGQDRGAFGKIPRVAPPAGQGIGQPTGQSRLRGHLHGLAGMGFAADEMEEVEQEPFDVEEIPRPEAEVFE